ARAAAGGANAADIGPPAGQGQHSAARAPGLGDRRREDCRPSAGTRPGQRPAERTRQTSGRQPDRASIRQRERPAWAAGGAKPGGPCRGAARAAVGGANAADIEPPAGRDNIRQRERLAWAAGGAKTARLRLAGPVEAE
ncbi:hypothetical protein, partial [Amycolatopsis sp. NPDC049159]|uniref:hypothetical protein n=1 Tax=Amycolatopsis sp. NPDC049159 TaxID=3157210 RepID=UPI0033CE0C61